MKKHINGILFAVLIVVLLALALSGCTKEGHVREKKHYGKVYVATNTGTYYTRSYDNAANQFIYWVFDTSSSASPMTLTGGTGSSSGGFSGNWVRASSLPNGLQPTSKVVLEEGERPTQEIQEETPAIENETITETTTEAQAETIEAPVIDASYTDPAGPSGDVGGTDAGTGGDAGGGDAGGGGGDGGGGGGE